MSSSHATDMMVVEAIRDVETRAGINGGSIPSKYGRIKRGDRFWTVRGEFKGSIIKVFVPHDVMVWVGVDRDAFVVSSGRPIYSFIVKYVGDSCANFTKNKKYVAYELGNPDCCMVIADDTNFKSRMEKRLFLMEHQKEQEKESFGVVGLRVGELFAVLDTRVGSSHKATWAYCNPSLAAKGLYQVFDLKEKWNHKPSKHYIEVDDVPEDTHIMECIHKAGENRLTEGKKYVCADTDEKEMVFVLMSDSGLPDVFCKSHFKQTISDPVLRYGGMFAVECIKEHQWAGCGKKETTVKVGSRFWAMRSTSGTLRAFDPRNGVGKWSCGWYDADASKFKDTDKMPNDSFFVVCKSVSSQFVTLGKEYLAYDDLNDRKLINILESDNKAWVSVFRSDFVLKENIMLTDEDKKKVEVMKKNRIVRMAVCINNVGIEERFDVDGKYEFRPHKTDVEMMMVKDKLGKIDEYFKDRFRIEEVTIGEDSVDGVEVEEKKIKVQDELERRVKVVSLTDIVAGCSEEEILESFGSLKRYKTFRIKLLKLFREFGIEGINDLVFETIMDNIAGEYRDGADANNEELQDHSPEPMIKETGSKTDEVKNLILQWAEALKTNEEEKADWEEYEEKEEDPPF